MATDIRKLIVKPYKNIFDAAKFIPAALNARRISTFTAEGISVVSPEGFIQ